MRTLYREHKRGLLDGVPLGYVRKSWEPYVVTAAGIDRPLYELAAMTELRNSLRSGDVWVPGSRQFKDFEDYLMPPAQFALAAEAGSLGIAIEDDGDHYLGERLGRLEAKLRQVDTLAQNGQLSGVDIAAELLTITSPKKSVPHAAEVLEEEACALLPHVKITDLLLEVDRWCDFTRHFTHQRTEQPPRDRTPLLTVVLADAINLGLSKWPSPAPAVRTIGSIRCAPGM